MSSNTSFRRRAVLGAVSHVLSCLALLVECVYVWVGIPLHKIPPARPGVEVAGRAIIAFHRWRLVRFLNYDDHLHAPPDWRRMYLYIGLRGMLGFLGAFIFVLIAFGGSSGAVMAYQVIRGRPMGGGSGDGSQHGNQWYEIGIALVLGTVLAFLAVCGLVGVGWLERGLAGRYLTPSEAELLRRRVTELADTRAAVVEAVNDERRRIERDLHDGVQQRLVALGMLLGRALRAKESGHATRLIEQAHEESQQALNDLREVTWRVYPSALDKDGLHAALEGVADRASVPVWLRYELAARPDLATETVVYFVASEAVTNALKHGDPTAIAIAVTREGDEIVVMVRDDGRGGADVTGSGLSGLASRVAAADGTFRVTSPCGGPTVVTARLPVSVDMWDSPDRTLMARDRV
jgi:signal transduction histidine kinase